MTFKTLDDLNDIAGKRVLVIGGAGFLGSHIVDQLTDTPAGEIIVLDNFVRGTRENLAAAEVTLSADDLARIEAAAAGVMGTRYTEAIEASTGL